MHVYMVAAPKLADGVNDFLRDRALTWLRSDASSDAEHTVEMGGRICYMSFGARQYRKTTPAYIENLIAQGHESVLEHANFTLLIDGLTRALSHQLVRHRVGFSYSQLSQQYHDESEAEFAEPVWLESQAELRQKWIKWRGDTRELYQALLNAESQSGNAKDLSAKERQRAARSMARSVLPNATLTTLVVTGNARAWRNMLRVRGDTVGDLEMRTYCVAVYEVLMETAPSLFSGFELAGDSQGKFLRAIRQ